MTYINPFDEAEKKMDTHILWALPVEVAQKNLPEGWVFKRHRDSHDTFVEICIADQPIVTIRNDRYNFSGRSVSISSQIEDPELLQKIANYIIDLDAIGKTLSDKQREDRDKEDAIEAKKETEQLESLVRASLRA